MIEASAPSTGKSLACVTKWCVRPTGGSHGRATRGPAQCEGPRERGKAKRAATDSIKAGARQPWKLRPYDEKPVRRARGALAARYIECARPTGRTHGRTTGTPVLLISIGIPLEISKGRSPVEPRPDASEGVQRPWWRRMFGG
jgi:hypothetical protein